MAHDNGGVGKKSVGGRPVAIWSWDSDSIAIRFNEAYLQLTGDAGDGDGFDLDGGSSNCVVEYNYSHDNVGDGYHSIQHRAQVRPQHLPLQCQ